MSVDVSDLIGGRGRGPLPKPSSDTVNSMQTSRNGPDGAAGLGTVEIGMSITGPADAFSDLSDSGGEDDILREVSLLFTCRRAVFLGRQTR